MSSKTERTDGTIPSWWWLLLAMTFIAAAALRVMSLGSGLWYDEIVTLVQSARHPFARIVTDFPGVNAHPLYSLIAHASLATFGESAWALRLPACVFGIASIAMVYILGAQLTTRTEAWAGCALLAASYHHVWFSQNARGYTLLGFLTLLGTWLLLRALRGGARRDYVCYAIVCAAGMYTHLTMTFVIAGHVAAVLAGMMMRWPPFERRSIASIAPLLWAWVGVGVLSAALYAPFVPGLIAWMGRDAPRAAAKVATAGWAASEALRAMFADSGIWASIVTGLLAVAGAWSLLRRAPFAAALLIAPGVVTAVGMVAAGQPIRPRFFFFLAGAAAIFMGRGLGMLVERFGFRQPSEQATQHSSAIVPGRALQPAIVVCTLPLLALSAAGLPRNYQVPKQDFDAAVARMTHEESLGARIVAAGPACLPLDEYYGKPWACVRREDEWNGLAAAGAQQPVLLLYTLLDYVDDPGLQQQLRTTCPVVARFEATLRGGDLVICRPEAGAASR
jgi:hypothetical protein